MAFDWIYLNAFFKYIFVRQSGKSEIENEKVASMKEIKLKPKDINNRIMGERKCSTSYSDSNYDFSFDNFISSPNFSSASSWGKLCLCNSSVFSCPLGQAKTVPEIQRTPYILNGYRICNYSMFCSLKTTFSLHNETCNIWTHLVGAIFFLVYGIIFLVENGGPSIPPNVEKYLSFSYFSSSFISCIERSTTVSSFIYCFFSFIFSFFSFFSFIFYPLQFICMFIISLFYDLDFLFAFGLISASFVCMCFSTIYHIFSSASNSLRSKCFTCDILGIIILIEFSFLAGVHFGYVCYPTLQLIYYVHSIILFIPFIYIILFLPVHSEKADKYTSIIFTVCASTGLIPVVHFVILQSSEIINLIGLYLLLMSICYILAIFFYLSKFPEKKWPGYFDYFFHSHQFWHVFVFFAAFSLVKGCSVVFYATRNKFQPLCTYA